MKKYILDLLYETLLSVKTQKRSEKIFLLIAIASFIVHLALIFLVNIGYISLNDTSALFGSPIAAIYTPFSFILVYEVYLLIYYLPRSLTTYVNKQYEIILLIIIRRLFKDLSNIKISSDWFAIKYDLQFTYDILTSLILFYLIYLFYTNSIKKNNEIISNEINIKGTSMYVRFKKIIAASLVPVVFLLAIYSFTNWLISNTISVDSNDQSFKNINNIFFEQFFSLLIIIDVILLLVSFFYTDEFHKVIRNSGFIISTILLRMSFNIEGIMNNILVIVAILFGLIILIIHNKFELKIANNNSEINK
ncbi:MAG: hypothetical protein ACK45U_03670 [bacterium]|jgi:hypothetical protein